MKASFYQNQKNRPMSKKIENIVDIDTAVTEFCSLLGNPPQWLSGSRKDTLPGTERSNVFQLSEHTGVANIIELLESAQIRSVAIIGINPAAFSAGLTLNRRQFNVSLIASGLEVASVRDGLYQSAVSSFFERNGITLHPYPAKSLKGSQIHCQSGYCGFVCEGRFIEEGDAIGCVMTENGNVYVGAAVIANT
jgi:hypothetical protein